MRRRRREPRGRKPQKKCKSCGTETRWLSVEGDCWDCCVKAVKNKSPIYIEPELPAEDEPPKPEE